MHIKERKETKMKRIKRKRFVAFYSGKIVEYMLELHEKEVWIYEDNVLCDVLLSCEIGITPYNFHNHSYQVMCHLVSPLAIVLRRYF